MTSNFERAKNLVLMQIKALNPRLDDHILAAFTVICPESPIKNFIYSAAEIRLEFPLEKLSDTELTTLGDLSVTQLKKDFNDSFQAFAQMYDGPSPFDIKMTYAGSDNSDYVSSVTIHFGLNPEMDGVNCSLLAFHFPLA